jgi:hypothetical protein
MTLQSSPSYVISRRSSPSTAASGSLTTRRPKSMTWRGCSVGTQRTDSPGSDHGGGLLGTIPFWFARLTARSIRGHCLSLLSTPWTNCGVVSQHSPVSPDPPAIHFPECFPAPGDLVRSVPADRRPRTRATATALVRLHPVLRGVAPAAGSRGEPRRQGVRRVRGRDRVGVVARAVSGWL